MLAEAWSTLGAVDRYRLGSETRGLGLSESFGVKDAYGDRWSDSTESRRSAIAEVLHKGFFHLASSSKLLNLLQDG